MRKLRKGVNIVIPKDKDKNLVEVLTASEIVRQQGFDTQGFGEGLANSESRTSGLYAAKSTTSSASGKYQYLYSTIKKYVPYLKNVTREQFLKNPSLQERVHKDVMAGEFHPDLQSPIKNGYDLKAEFLDKNIDLGLGVEEIGAMSHFMGRQGAREALERYVEEGNLHFKPKVGINKYIDQYLEEFNESMGKKVDSLPSILGEEDVPEEGYQRLLGVGQGNTYMAEFSQGGEYDSRLFGVKEGVVFSNNKNYTPLNNYLRRYKEAALKNGWDTNNFVVTSASRQPKHAKDFTRHADHNHNSSALDLRYNLDFGAWSMLPEQVDYRKANDLVLLPPNHGTALHWHLSHKTGGGSESYNDIGYGTEDKYNYKEWLKTDAGRELADYQLKFNEQLKQTTMPTEKITTNPNTGKVLPYVTPIGSNLDTLSGFQEVGLQYSEAMSPQYTNEYTKQIEEQERRAKETASTQNILTQIGSMNTGMSDRLFMAGESVGFDIEANHSALSKNDKRKVKSANLIRGIASGLGALLGGARNFLGGMAYSKAESERSAAMRDRLAILNKYNKEYFEEGGVFKNVSDSEAFTQDYKIEKEDISSINSFVEKGERTKTLDNKVYEVKGKTHEDGGVGVHLQDGEKILSNDRKIGQELAKKLRQSIDIKVYARTTYAEALDKFERKIGIKEIQKEQQDIFDKIEKNENIEDKGTAEQNLTFYSQKLSEIEKEKQPLEDLQSVLFDYLWEKQEEGKPKKRKNVERNNSEHKEVFEDGGQFGSIGFINHSHAQQSYGHQGSSGDYYGNIETSLNDRLTEYKRLFPRLFDAHFEEDSAGIHLKDGVTWKDFQENYNTFLLEQREVLKNDQNSDIVDKFYNGNIFIGGEDSVRGIDNKGGQYTTSRGVFTKKVVRPATFDKLKDKGITHIAQLANLSKEEIKSLGLSEKEWGMVKEDFAKGASYIIDYYEPDKSSKNKRYEPIKVDTERSSISKKQSGLPDYNPVRTNKSGHNLYIPAQGRRLPRAIEIPALQQVRLDKVDMFKADVFPYIVESNRNRIATEEQIENTNDSTNKLLIGSIAAQNQQNIGRAMSEVASRDIQAALRRDQLNSNISNQEEFTNVNLRQGYEEKVFAAKAATDLDYDNYFEAQRKDMFAENLMQHQANVLSDSSENYHIDSFGNVAFSPNSSNYIYDLSKNPTELSRADIIKKKAYQKYLETQKKKKSTK